MRVKVIKYVVLAPTYPVPKQSLVRDFAFASIVIKHFVLATAYFRYENYHRLCSA